MTKSKITLFVDAENLTQWIKNLEKYTAILRAFNWRLVSKDSIFQINARLKNAPPMERQELVEFLLNSLSDDRPHIGATEIRKTLSIFSKSGLLNVVEKQAGPQANKLDYKFVTGFTKLIDQALVSRLLQGCKDSGIEFNLKIAKDLLYSDYTNESTLLKLLTNVEKETYLNS